MGDSLLVWLPFALFMYGFLFGIFLLPALAIGYIRLRTASSKQQKIIGWTSLLLPVYGFVFYGFIDYFESFGLAGVWWVMMLIIHSSPVAVGAYYIHHDRAHLLSAKNKHKRNI